MFAAQMATATRAEAAKKWRNPTTANSELLPPTVQQAADLLSVGHSPVHRAKHIPRTAAPEVTAAVRAGHLTLHSAKHIADAMRGGRAADREEQPRYRNSGIVCGDY